MFKYQFLNINLSDEGPHAKLLKLVGKGKRVLECGCASGYTSKVLKESLACKVTGIEISAEAAIDARRYCDRVFVVDIERIDFKELLGDAQFDVITFGDVLEHLREPNTVLEKIHPFLSEDGFVLASIPNVAHLSVALELLSGRFDYRPIGLLDNTHLRFFTKKSIVSLFNNSGYEIVHWDRVILKPEDTEFKTDLGNYPNCVSSYIGLGEEALTYQFIVKAIPAKVSNGPDKVTNQREKAGVQELRDELVERMNQIAMLKEKEALLESIYKSWSWKITAPLRMMISAFLKRS